MKRSRCATSHHDVPTAVPRSAISMPSVFEGEHDYSHLAPSAASSSCGTTTPAASTRSTAARPRPPCNRSRSRPRGAARCTARGPAALRIAQGVGYEDLRQWVRRQHRRPGRAPYFSDTARDAELAQDWALCRLRGLQTQVNPSVQTLTWTLAMPAAQMATHHCGTPARECIDSPCLGHAQRSAGHRHADPLFSSILWSAAGQKKVSPCLSHRHRPQKTD